VLTRREMKEILLASGLRLSRRKGQVFVTSRKVLTAAARAALDGVEREAAVFEFGAGLGNLTRALAERAGWVFSVEIDAGLLRQASRLLSDLSNVSLVGRDGLSGGRIDPELLEEFVECADERGLRRLVFAGNIPYAASGAILLSLPALPARFERCVVMAQAEVARRIQARPGSREYGLLAAVVQRSFDVRRLMRVGPEAFHPTPEVSSALLLLRRTRVVEPAEHRRQVNVLEGVFSMRRKTLRSVLRGRFGLTTKEAEEMLESVGVGVDRRAGQLEEDQIWRLVDMLAER